MRAIPQRYRPPKPLPRNLTGHPCVAIPHGGATSLGFIGRPFAEATILALAKAYQDATGFHTNRPPTFVR